MFMRFMFPLIVMIVFFVGLIYCLLYVDNKVPKKPENSDEEEGEFELVTPAPHWKRLCAFLIDWFVAMAAIFTVSKFYTLLNVDKDVTVLFYLFNYLYIAIVMGYSFIQESIYSSTIGKMILGLRVENLKGENISWQSAYVRNSFKVLNVFGLIDCIVALAREDKRRFGDLAARTRVV